MIFYDAIIKVETKYLGELDCDSESVSNAALDIVCLHWSNRAWSCWPV